MRVDCALLCDAASVREGLLHVLGGGLTRLGRERFPAPAGLQIALRLSMSQAEALKRHRVVVTLRRLGADRPEEGELTFDWEIASAGDVEEGEDLTLPVAIPAEGFMIPAPGAWQFVLRLDDATDIAWLPFRAFVHAAPPVRV